MVAGLLLVLSAVIGSASLLLGLALGIGFILVAGHLKHRLWSGGALIVGILSYSAFEGIMAQGGAVLAIAAAGLGLASTFI